MAVFTSNQVNHVYVAKDVKGGSNSVGYALSSGSAVKPSVSSIGDIFCWKTADNELYFTYKNGDGGIVRSDLIPIKNIMWARAVSGNHRSQKRGLKIYTITAPSSPTVGETYCVNVEIKLHEGIETVYRKQAFAVAVTGDTQTKICEKLAKSLKANFERDDYVKDLFTISTYSANDTTVTITEKSQSATYKRGTFANNEVEFTVFSDNVAVTGPTVSNYVGNAYDIADLEYFALGERGDLYRNVGWPNSFPSKTVADAPSDSDHYNLVQIHFAFTDSNEGVQKSEKDITIAIPESSTTVTKVNRLLSQIAYQVLGDDNSGSQGAATGGNTAFVLTNAKVNVLDIPGGKKTQLD